MTEISSSNRSLSQYEKFLARKKGNQSATVTTEAGVFNTDEVTLLIDTHKHGLQPATFREIVENAGAQIILTAEQVAAARELNQKFKSAVALIARYNHVQAGKDLKAARTAAVEEPTEENFAALVQLGDRARLEESYNDARQAAKQALKNLCKNEIFPFLDPLLAQVLQQVEDAARLWYENDLSQRSRYPSLNLGPSPIIQAVCAGVGMFKRSLKMLGSQEASPRALLSQIGCDLLLDDARADVHDGDAVAKTAVASHTPD